MFQFPTHGFIFSLIFKKKSEIIPKMERCPSSALTVCFVSDSEDGFRLKSPISQLHGNPRKWLVLLGNFFHSEKTSSVTIKS